jgi:hypothetical protein
VVVISAVSQPRMNANFGESLRALMCKPLKVVGENGLPHLFTPRVRVGMVTVTATDAIPSQVIDEAEQAALASEREKATAAASAGVRLAGHGQLRLRWVELHRRLVRDVTPTGAQPAQSSLAGPRHVESQRAAAFFSTADSRLIRRLVAAQQTFGDLQIFDGVNIGHTTRIVQELTPSHHTSEQRSLPLYLPLSPIKPESKRWRNPPDGLVAPGKPVLPRFAPPERLRRL